MARVSEMRQLIRELGDEAPEHELRDLLDEAELELRNVRRVADLLLTAFFEGGKPKERESKRVMYANLLLAEDQAATAAPAATKLPVTPLHWELEFPEVFERENPGFDAIVGNPPFAGKNTVAAAHATGYPDWLKQLHAESHGNSDLVRLISFAGRSTSCAIEARSVSLPQTPLGRAIRARPGCVGSANTKATSTVPGVGSNGPGKQRSS